MRRLFIFSMLAMMIAFGIGGCGSEGTSADPLGTDGITFGHKNDVAGTDWTMALQVDPGATAVLTAKVKSVSGNAVVGREVAFVFKSNASGATINVSSAITDGSGEAVIIYRAGLNSGFDIVRASLSNGSQMETNITIGTAAPPAPTPALAVSIAASTGVAPVTAGQVSIITATVTRGSTVAGVPVSFTLPINNSGATLSAATATTDGSGNAVVIYQPGTASPTLPVQDTVQAAVGTATSTVAITRAGSVAPALAVSLVASTGATPLTAGQVSIITATVTGGATVAGVLVSFTLPVNNSGATLSAATATTDGSGNAVVIYQSGIASPALPVQDTVQAVVGTATSTVVITRAGLATAGFSIIVSAAPPTVSILGGSSVITANVKNNLGTPESGATVNFASSGGSVLPASAITDGSGNAVTVFTAGAGVSGTTAGVVTAGVTIGGTTFTAAVVITYP